MGNGGDPPPQGRERIREWLAQLDRAIASHRSMLVAYSGGVDSTLLGYCAKAVLGAGSRCVLLDSPTVSRHALTDAVRTAEALSLELEVISAPVLEDREFIRNKRDRCYRCRKILFGILKARAASLDLACVADGTSLSDLHEDRPGMRAAREEGIVHPFIEAGLGKEEIRAIARYLGLPVWNRPADSCLATRVPHGMRISRERLELVEAAESILRQHGIHGSRVRLHGKLARIEVPPPEMERILALREELLPPLLALGLAQVTLDLAGHRRG